MWGGPVGVAPGRRKKKVLKKKLKKNECNVTLKNLAPFFGHLQSCWGSLDEIVYQVVQNKQIKEKLQ